MGKISKGILGPFQGKVGTVIGGTWKGISYMRSISGTRRKNFTQAQLEQQAKFSLVVQFTAPMADLFSTSFYSYADRMSGVNSAQSYTLRNAITGQFPNYSIAYNLALVSRGDLPMANAPAAATAGDNVNFSWQSNAGLGRAKETDTAIMVAYCPVMNAALFSLQGPERQTGAGSLNVSVFKGNLVHTWLAFLSSEKGINVSNSVYTGALTIA